jgi:hypothetical protein
MLIIICGVIITSIVFIKNNTDKSGVVSQSKETSQTSKTESTSPTPAPTVQVTPSPQPVSTPVETDIGQILYEKKVDLNGDNIDEDVQIRKIKDKTDSQEYDGVLVITGKDTMIKETFLQRSETNLLGVFSGVEFVDLDNDGAKDVFITIPDVGADFNISYFYAYNYKKQKAYSYNSDNMDLIGNLIGNFKFNYAGNGILNIKNDSFGFTSDINLKDNAGFSSSEDLNKASYNKAWIPTPPVDIDQNTKLDLFKTNKNQWEVEIPLTIFGQATSDILGNINTYFSFTKDFKLSLTSFEVQEINGSGKKVVGSKITQ